MFNVQRLMFKIQSVITLTLLGFAVPLHAQLPVLPFAPGTFEPAGLMSLRKSAPFRAKITEKKGTAGNFTLTLEKTDGSGRTTYTLIGGGEAERKMFEHFKLGARYDFPKVFDDVLGKDTTSSTRPAFVPASPASAAMFPPFASKPKLGLLDLNHCAPFRAKIASKTITPESASITLACTDGRTFTVQEMGSRLDEALRIVKPLEEGRFYEFPVSTLPPHQDQPAPPTPAMKALEPFIGEWQISSLDDPDQQLRVRYHWKINGTGLWREHTGRTKDSDEYRMVAATLTTHDSATGRYVEIPTRSSTTPPIEKTWDAAIRMLISVQHVQHPEGERKITTITSFKTDDLVEVKSTITTKEGKFIEEHQGRYTRIKP